MKIPQDLSELAKKDTENYAILETSNEEDLSIPGSKTKKMDTKLP